MNHFIQFRAQVEETQIVSESGAGSVSVDELSGVGAHTCDDNLVLVQVPPGRAQHLW